MFFNTSSYSQTVKRGDIFQLNNSKRGTHDGEFYQLVRVAADMPAGVDTLTGKAVGGRHDLYNLVNTSTGKTRVSDPARLFKVPAGGSVYLRALNSHFQLDLKRVTDVPTIAADVERSIRSKMPKPAAVHFSRAANSNAEEILCAVAGALGYTVSRSAYCF